MNDVNALSMWGLKSITFFIKTHLKVMERHLLHEITHWTEVNVLHLKPDRPLLKLGCKCPRHNTLQALSG